MELNLSHGLVDLNSDQLGKMQYYINNFYNIYKHFNNIAVKTFTWVTWLILWFFSRSRSPPRLRWRYDVRNEGWKRMRIFKNDYPGCFTRGKFKHPGFAPIHQIQKNSVWFMIIHVQSRSFIHGHSKVNSKFIVKFIFIIRHQGNILFRAIVRT